MKFKVKNRNPRPMPKTLYRPAEYVTVEQLPSGKWDTFESPELQAIPKNPLYMVCDCCLTKVDRLWVMRHRGFCTGFPKAGNLRRDFLEGGWSFCVFCWPLFQRNDISVLTARVHTLNPDIDAHRLRVMYEVLRDVTHGEPITWESGDEVFHV